MYSERGEIMEELYNLIEDKIRSAGYLGAVNGMEVYDEICDEMGATFSCLKKKITYSLNTKLT